MTGCLPVQWITYRKDLRGSKGDSWWWKREKSCEWTGLGDGWAVTGQRRQ